METRVDVPSGSGVLVGGLSCGRSTRVRGRHFLGYAELPDKSRCERRARVRARARVGISVRIWIRARVGFRVRVR